MRIDQFDPAADEDRLRACHQMFSDSRPADDPTLPPPSLAMYRSWLARGPADEPQQCWAATAESGELLGCYVLQLPRRENRGSGFLGPLTAAGARRRGVGTALVGHAARQAQRAGRALLMSDARAGSPGAAFAAALGATPGLQDARRVLDTGPELHARLPGLRAEAEARAAGYTLRRWTGPTPGDLTAGVCALIGAMADAPHSDSYEPETWDEARLREADERAAARGSAEYAVAAVHDASGALAALTQVTVDPAGQEGWGHQQITAVTRPHRGHRLGMLIKVAMLQWLAGAEPGLRHIQTFNAVPNAHMIAVNEALGHRVTDYFQGYELTVAAALALPVPA